MPIVTFTFSLPEEQPELELFQQAVKFHSALCEITQKFRTIEKWGSEEEQTMHVEMVREIIHAILREMGVEL
jgi:hypothetical protein